MGRMQWVPHLTLGMLLSGSLPNVWEWSARTTIGPKHPCPQEGAATDLPGLGVSQVILALLQDTEKEHACWKYPQNTGTQASQSTNKGDTPGSGRSSMGPGSGTGCWMLVRAAHAATEILGSEGDLMAIKRTPCCPGCSWMICPERVAVAKWWLVVPTAAFPYLSSLKC